MIDIHSFVKFEPAKRGRESDVDRKYGMKALYIKDRYMEKHAEKKWYICTICNSNEFNCRACGGSGMVYR